MDGQDRGWSLELGLYPGVLIGFRTYEAEDLTTHVLYLPFVDIALILEK
jgi:hypothetical protein|tara:strand:- start:44 stop:190 length:147 start_codon:yes stop_codon:yes gene_type:complete